MRVWGFGVCGFKGLGLLRFGVLGFKGFKGVVFPAEAWGLGLCEGKGLTVEGLAVAVTDGDFASSNCGDLDDIDPKTSLGLVPHCQS